MATVIASETFGAATLRRIEWLTLACWAARGRRSGLPGVWAGGAGGVGLALGAGLSWVNFRWLKGSVQAFGSVATAQVGATGTTGGIPGRARAVGVPGKVGAFPRVSAYLEVSWPLRFIARRSLYVILTRSWLPAVSVLAGLFASAAAVVVGLVYELLSSGVRQNASG